jgi:hypothetical protein
MFFSNQLQTIDRNDLTLLQNYKRICTNEWSDRECNLTLLLRGEHCPTILAVDRKTPVFKLFQTERLIMRMAAVLLRRHPRTIFEYPTEMTERIVSEPGCDFMNWKVRRKQKTLCVVHLNARKVLHNRTTLALPKTADQYGR